MVDALTSCHPHPAVWDAVSLWERVREEGFRPILGPQRMGRFTHGRASATGRYSDITGARWRTGKGMVAGVVMTGRRLAGRVAGVVVLVAVLVAGSSIAAPAPRAAAAAPTAAPPVPEGLWDTPVAVPAGKTYALVEPVPGGPAAAVPAATYTRSDSVITVSDGVYAYGIGVAALDYGTGFNVKRRSGTAPLIDMGFHSDLDAVWLGTPFDCADPNGWLAVDSVATDPDGGITSFEYRFEMSCGTTVAVHMKGRVVGADTATPPGPEPVPCRLVGRRTAGGSGPELRAARR